MAANGTVAVALPRAGGIALQRRGIVRRIQLGGSPHDVKLAGNVVVIANEGAARLDLVRLTGSVVGRVKLKANPHDVAITRDGQHGWVSLDGLDELAFVDVASRQVVRYVRTGQRPHDLLVAPDGRLWVTDWDEGVRLYTRRGALVGRILAGIQVHHLAFAPDGEQASLTDHRDGRVIVVDARNLHILASLQIQGSPHHVTITPDGRWAAVADHDGGRLLLLAAETRRLKASIAVGSGPHGVWAVPARP